MTDDAAVVVLDTLTIRRCLNPDGTDSIDLHVEGLGRGAPSTH